MSGARWAKGSQAVWRSLPGGEVATVLSTFVVEDGSDAIALFQPLGAPCQRRTGRRGGPSGRSMLPDGWDGGYDEVPFRGPSVVRVHPIGQSFSVIRNWDPGEQLFSGWYVNLEQPWIRTPIGFDSHDDVLDVTVANDLGSWSWKDIDELAWSVEVGKLSASHAEAARQAGRAAIALIESRNWPFQDSAWHRFMPERSWGLPRLPHDWSRTDWS